MTFASAKVRSPVRCGRDVCAAAALEAHLDPVGGAGQRAEAQPHLADVDARVAVQGEDPLDVVEGAQPHQVDGAAGHDLLGGLEEQPHPAVEQPGGRRPRPARGPRRRGPSCARRARRRGRPRRRCCSTGRRSRPGRAARRCPPAARPRWDPAPSSATSPVRGSRVTRQPASSRRRATSRVVRTSSHDGSGWACRSRRSPTSSASCFSTTLARSEEVDSSAGIVSEVSSRRPPTVPAVHPRVGQRRQRSTFPAGAVPGSRPLSTPVVA